jgi:hypothetical protein
MNVRICLKTLCVLIVGFACVPLYATTWYVRPDGGTRYSSNVSNGQCDGKADAAPSGGKANQHCAFKDVRMLWQDGTYAAGAKFPNWGWVIAGGDTVIIRGSIGTGVSYRVGWEHPSYSCDKNPCWGQAGDPYGSGAPPPPSGTATQHTRILGENYVSCRDASAKTQLHGGGATYTVLDLSGTSYVDVACLDITDFSACGKASQKVGCDSKQDFAQVGVRLSNKTTNLTLTDLHIHGLAISGIAGPTGDGVVMDHIDILGNASSGWNADDGTTGKGSLLVQHYDISWNGCAEEYPIAHPLPYGDCTDQDSGGYGDGFGTTTKDSDPPGWQVHFDKGTASYNTQDGLDALHIGGVGSSMTVTDSLAYSNMGQQLKVGGATATLIGNYVVGNCRAMSNAIPGTPPGYNARLGLFCRAGDTAIFIDMPVDRPAIFQHNIVFSNNHVALELEYVGDPSPKASIKYDDNIFVGFPNSEGHYPSPIYSTTDLKMLTNTGASFTNNVTYHPKSDWQCPATSLRETGGSCKAPHLKDVTWHPYGYGDATLLKSPDTSSLNPEPGSARGVSYKSVIIDSVGVAILVTGTYRGLLFLRDRTKKG